MKKEVGTTEIKLVTIEPTAEMRRIDRVTFSPNQLVLSNENLSDIAPERLDRRSAMAAEFAEMPEDFFTLMKHLQPEVGCGNVCQMCSQGASASTTVMTREGYHDVMAALKAAAVSRFPNNEGPLISRGKKGRVTPFLDNDSFSSNPHVEDQIRIHRDDFGAKTVYSTVGYSRKNAELVEMHKRIAASDLLYSLHRVRMSWTKFPLGADIENDSEYMRDIANVIDTYRRLVEDPTLIDKHILSFEIRYAPHIEKNDVEETVVNGRHIIKAGPHLLIANELDTIPAVIDVTRSPTKVEIEHSGPEHSYLLITSDTYRDQAITDIDLSEYTLGNQPENSDPTKNITTVQLSRWSNHGGEYFTVNPYHNRSEKTFTAMHFYKKSDTRKESGFNNATRFPANIWVKFKKERFGIDRKDTPQECTWEDVQAFQDLMEVEVAKIAQYDSSFAEHVRREQITMYTRLITVLKLANYQPKMVFDGEFIKDTGQIINQGRAINLFQGLATTEDDPMTPNDRRNDVRVQALDEKRVWRLAPLPVAHVHNRRRLGNKNTQYLDGDQDGSVIIGGVVVQKLHPHSLYPDPEFLHQMRVIGGVELRSLSAHEMKNRFLMPGV